MASVTTREIASLKGNYMSIPRGFGINGKSFYTNIAQPIDVNLNFVVDSTNGNGLGIRSLKSNGYVESVFMNTSATPGKVGNITNPNPAAGYAIVRFKNNFNKYIGGFSGIILPTSGSTLTSVTAGSPYVITALGTATTAQWVAVGFPVGMTPAVGAAFVASATGTIGGSASVKAPGISQISDISVVGDPNLTIANSNVAFYAGAQVLVQFYGATSSSVTTQIAVAPSNESIVGMTFRFDGSSVTVDGL